ncbi:S8 family serine peptidase [Streptomyces sp. NBC_01537]|uniref:S8 family serine peptidase n=1 Tax=Streptomyces sp. NBC_01537 TaxID=2903896 RepID=UPI003870E796
MGGLLARRALFADESGRSATRVALHRTDPDTNGLAAAGELLVAGEGREEAARLLRRRGFTHIGTAGSVVRLMRPTAGMAEILGACDALRGLGVSAAPNYVTAVAAVGKGGSGLGLALPTTAMPGDRPVDDPRGAGVRVAVIDTGIAPESVGASHGWLDGIEVDHTADGNCDLLDAVPAPDGFLDEAAGHGTFVAGIVRQIAPSCHVQAIKVLDSDGVGTDFSVAEALFRLADAQDAPDLVNLSLVCSSDETTGPIAIEAAIEALTMRHPATLVVAAAGNDGGATKATRTVSVSSGR